MLNVETLTKEKEAQATENFHLQMENRELRDRIEILESVVATSNLNSNDLDGLDWREVF
jgi:regulator of replication initiation timing